MELESLVRRIEDLERSNRRLRRLALVAFAGVAAVALVAGTRRAEADTPKELEAESFTLKNAEGKKIAALMENKAGGPSFELYDSDGKARLAIGVRDDTPGIVMIGGDGKVRGTIALAANDEVGIVLSDTKGRNRLAIACEKDGTPAIVLRDAKGPRALFYQTNDGEAGLAVNDKNGKQRVVLATAAKSEIPILVFKTPEGAANAALGLNEDGSASIELHDAKGEKVFSKP